MPNYALTSLSGKEFEFYSCPVHKQACLVYRIKDNNRDSAEKELMALGVMQGNFADFFVKKE